MNHKFDELTKSLAQSATRREALKKFGIGLAGMALACFGLAQRAEAGNCIATGSPCRHSAPCCSDYCGSNGYCACKPSGMVCTSDGQCCTGRCDSNGVCACVPVGSPCGAS